MLPPSTTTRAGTTSRASTTTRAGTTPARRVVVCGDVINDLLVKPLDGVTAGSDTPATILARPGGSAANQAAWMAHFGADVVFAGRAGARDAGYHRRELARAGVRAHRPQPRPGPRRATWPAAGTTRSRGTPGTSG